VRTASSCVRPAQASLNMSQLAVVGVCATLTAVIQLSGFAVAFALQTEVFYDILGGVNYMAVAAYSAHASSSTHPFSGDMRKVLSTGLFICSRAWLLLFLAWRAHERGGDARFDGVKDKFGKFLVFWIVQGMWVMLISMPQLFINSSTMHRPDFTVWDWTFIVGFGICVSIEIMADVQKAIWVKLGRIGGFCQTGVWALSRHPNYFGEIAQWWFAWAFAYSSSIGIADKLWWCCIVSPLFTMQILLNMKPTGISNAEGTNLRRYYENNSKTYQDYRDRTSVLIPMVGYRYVPLFLKRTIFFDFERYEYRVGTENCKPE